MVTAAEEKRLEVLRRIQDTYRHPTGPRLHETLSKSRSVRPEVYMLEQLGLIEPCDRDGETGWRRTTAGDAHLAERPANLPPERKSTMTPTPEDADALAAKAHTGQIDKAGRPYVEHVRTVAGLLRHHGDHAVMAGLLHDIVEDTTVTLDELRRHGYPEDVISAVDSVTRRDHEDYLDMVRRAAADPLGRLVKLADNATNADENRLELLPTKVADRLRRKYAKAHEILIAAELDSR